MTSSRRLDRAPAHPSRFVAGAFAALSMLAFALPQPAHAQRVALGAGAYHLSPKGGDRLPPSAPMRTDAMLKTAAQTNQWYSTLIFSDKPEPIYAQPLSFRPTGAGFEIAMPVKEVVPTERGDVEIHYPHKNPIVVSATAFEAGPGKLAKAGDWSIDIAMAGGSDQLVVTVAHGSPYASFRITRGDVRLRLPDAGTRIDTPADPRVLALKVGERTWAAFGPAGVRWESVSATEWTGRLPAGKGYFSIAAMPDAQPATLQLLARHAYAFLTDTRVDWQVDTAASRVETSFTATTQAMEGDEKSPLLGLYPHHWFRNASVDGKLGPAYETVRGQLKLLAAPVFRTTATYPGFVPWWPRVSDSTYGDELNDVMKSDLRNARRMMLEIGNGPYWQGKGLQRIVKLIDVVEVQGRDDEAKRLLGLVQRRFQDWFSGDSRKTYFVHDKSLGTVVAYPEEYFSVEQMNDHHFHYGYWIRAAAEIAMRDPAWAAKDRWGGMVDLLVADIATTRRGGSDFPFLRTFDAYESHSWASGLGLGATGNNQESSSEAINAWVGLILWGEVNGDRALRDLGIWMYTSEIQAIEHYWFDVHGLVFPPEYQHVEVSMVFGAKYAHNTWWTDEPRQIKGINLLPMTTASAYMGRDPAYIKRSLATLKGDTDTWLSRFGKGYGQVPRDIWQDIFAKYMALSDPGAALASWDRWGSFEFGDTRTHALHTLLNLQQMGTPDLSVTANTSLYAVFRRADGSRTHLAYNAGKSPIEVRFSDGKTLTVAPGTLAQTR